MHQMPCSQQSINLKAGKVPQLLFEGLQHTASSFSCMGRAFQSEGSAERARVLWALHALGKASEQEVPALTPPL